MSGGVDIRPFPEKWGIAKRLGSYEDNPQAWEENTVINLTHLLKPESLNLIIDCGTGDFFYEVNCNLHKKLLDEGIPHDFISRPGVHNWDYWSNSIKYQIVFFNDHFVR
jgi:S-formylglutathione hydrolase FrmB